MWSWKWQNLKAILPKTRTSLKTSWKTSSGLPCTEIPTMFEWPPQVRFGTVAAAKCKGIPPKPKHVNTIRNFFRFLSLAYIVNICQYSSVMFSIYCINLYQMFTVSWHVWVPTMGSILSTVWCFDSPPPPWGLGRHHSCVAMPLLCCTHFSYPALELW